MGRKGPHAVRVLCCLRPSNRAGDLKLQLFTSQHVGLSWASTMLPALQAAVGRPCPGPTLLPEVSGDCDLTLARLYGDESELHFWTVAAHYLHSLSQEKAASTPVAKEAAPQDRVNNPLDICYDILCENAYFQVLCFVY